MSCFPDSLVPKVQQPLFSFIIPVFNEEKNIGRCLNSIRNLLFPNQDYEVFIVDNGSTDGTHQIIRELNFNFTVIPKVHVSYLRNWGAGMAKGEYLAFVDSDIELAPEWLKNGLEAFKGPSVVASGCFPRVPPEATWVERAKDLHQCGRHNGILLRPVSWLPSANFLVRREDFLAIGGFNENLETAEDVDLGYRLGKRGILLRNLTMEAIHWGEDKNLATLWRKEVWRGMGNLTGVLSHGLFWDELPSLGYPLYMLILVMASWLGGFVDLGQGQVFFGPLSLGLLCLPALLLAVNTARLARRPAAFPSLFLVYLIYGLARAYSVARAALVYRV